MSLLSLSHVNKSYGATVALANGNLDLHPGEIHVLMGSNGSGKSTLCKIISGSVRPDSGEVFLDGKPIQIENPASAKTFAISTFYQELSLAENRSVAENISMGQLPVKAGLIDKAKMHRTAQKAFIPFQQVIGEDFAVDDLIKNLRPDQQQLVEIMKTFSPEAQILVFDEPTSALDKAQTQVFFAELQKRKSQGASIVFISHRFEEVFEIADRVTVIRDGKTISCHLLSETSENQIVSEMIGEDVGVNTGFQPPEIRDSQGVHLSAQKLVNAKLKSVSFELRKGEILGLGGLHGQGQSSLLRALYGVEPKQGSITYQGSEVKLQSPRHAIKQGMAYVSGDRRRDGSISGRSILENVTPIVFFKRSMKLIRQRKTAQSCKQALEFLSTKYPSLKASIGCLSGGNQQKVIIARWLIDKPEILLLDDPTKGIDIVTKNELFDLIRRLASEGMSIILYSSEDAELLANSDRILVFNNGAVTRELNGSDRTHFNLTQASFEAAQ